jgi:uncharacterized protein YhfF
MDWQKLETFSFGDNPAMADRLAALVLEGKKTATCWATVEGLKGVEVGKQWVVLSGDGRPLVVIETVELTQCRFDEVGAEFAQDEGEGDQSLEYWRRAHQTYFTRNNQFSEDMILYCERFRVVERLQGNDEASV